MQKQLKLAEAKARFSEVVQSAMLGNTIVVTRDNRPVVRITAIKPPKRTPGTGKGIWMAEDFDSTPADFAGYI